MALLTTTVLFFDILEAAIKDDELGSALVDICEGCAIVTIILT